MLAAKFLRLIYELRMEGSTGMNDIMFRKRNFGNYNFAWNSEEYVYKCMYSLNLILSFLICDFEILPKSMCFFS